MGPFIVVNKFEFEIITYLDKDYPVAEIYYEGHQWSSIFPNNGKLISEFYPHPNQKDWVFSFRQAAEILEKARNRLLEKLYKDAQLFPEVSGTPEQINRKGQKILEEIISHPQAEFYPNRFGGKDIFEPLGKGARYDKEGNFLGFLQRRQWVK
jgi:hypothetical protein